MQLDDFEIQVLSYAARKQLLTTEVVEQIVYLADMTEAGRNFIDVHTLRAAVNQNLNLGMYYALKISIANVLDKGGLLPRHTIEAYNQYVQIVAGMKD